MDFKTFVVFCLLHTEKCVVHRKAMKCTAKHQYYMTCTYFFSVLEHSLECVVKTLKKLVTHQSFMHLKLVTMAVNANPAKILKWINLQHILYTLPQVFLV